MSLYVTSLNSGSNGNCYYIGTESEAILVDAGISCRETEKRMKNLGLSLHNVKAVFISHEHTDHTRGLGTISGKYQLPVYINQPTLRKISSILNPTLIRHFETGDQIKIGELVITPFSKRHDAIDPVSFIVEGNHVKISVITDIGAACDKVIHYFSQSHASFLETNYDEQMLENGRYPYHLKKRIRSGFGHLSNSQALELFKNHRPSYMSHVFLAHLSKENNCPDLVQKLFSNHAGDTHIIVASRFKETAVYHISNAFNTLATVKMFPQVQTAKYKVRQISLFEEEV